MNLAPFVALLSSPQRARSNRLAGFIERMCGRQGLEVLHDDPALLLLGTPGAALHRLPGGGGLIWGRLFDRWTGSPISRPGPGAMFDDPAEHFVRRFWGGYVALRMMGGVPEILRDPSGDVPCYHASVDGCHIATSRPHLLFDAGLLSAEIDWTIIAQALAFRDLRPARTALRGVAELLPGMVARLNGDRLETHCVWTPWLFAAPDNEISGFDAAVQRVRETTEMCLRAWNSCFDRPIVEISGGLDSGIVAAGLSLAGSMPGSITYASADGDPDERPYAEAIAAHLGLDLRTARLDLANVDLTKTDARDLPRPCARNFAQALDRPGRQLAVETGGDGFFSGGGGDNVFCHVQSALPVVDRLRREGFGTGVLSTAVDVARLAQVTIWEVMATASRRMMRAPSTLPTARRNRFLSAGAAEALPWPAGHPWLEAPSDTPPGKRRHIWSLIGIQNHLEGYGRLDHAPIVSPLLSQPLVELCLRIPSWLWCEGGNNRAVARAAFRDALPDVAIARRSKGAFDAFGAQLIDANRPMLRAMLLEGRLAAAGLLDRDSVSHCLGAQLPDGEAIVQLLAIADIEAWARAWEERPRDPG